MLREIPYVKISDTSELGVRNPGDLLDAMLLGVKRHAHIALHPFYTSFIFVSNSSGCCRLSLQEQACLFFSLVCTTEFLESFCTCTVL